MNHISDIKHVFYINLDSRSDRKIHMEKQLTNLGITAKRFKAIQLKNGALGCSMSHLKILQQAQLNNLDHVLILEDDILFLNPPIFINQLNKFLSNHKKFDVLLFAGNNIPPYTQIDDSCIKVNKCQTTTGYLVKKHYFNTLIDNFKEGIQKLIHNPTLHKYYAIDKYWFNIQGIHNWYLITPLTVTQKEDYSDIEKRHTNYNHIMLDLDKIQFLKMQKEQQRQLFLPKMSIF